MSEHGYLKGVIEGNIPNHIVAEYGDFVITQNMSDHPTCAAVPPTVPPRVAVSDGEHFGIYNLTHFDSVDELKKWLDDLDLRFNTEARKPSTKCNVWCQYCGSEIKNSHLSKVYCIDCIPSQGQCIECGTKLLDAERVRNVEIGTNDKGRHCLWYCPQCEENRVQATREND